MFRAKPSVNHFVTKCNNMISKNKINSMQALDHRQIPYFSLFNSTQYQQPQLAIQSTFQEQQTQSKFYSTQVQGKQNETIENTVGYYLSKNAREMPYANAFKSTHQKINWSWSNLKKHAEALACGLVEMGLRPGDRLALIQGMNAELIVCMLACSKIGAVCVPLPEVKNSKDLTRFVELLRPRVVISSTKIENKNYYSMIREVVPELSITELHVPFKSKRFPFCKQILFTDKREKSNDNLSQFKDILVYGPFGYYETPLRRIAMQIDSNQPNLILFNDSNPDKAKAIVYSQKNILNAGMTIARKLELSQNDRVMVPKYSTKTIGSILGHFSAFMTKGVVVYPNEVYDIAKTIETLHFEECTTLFMELQDLDDLLNHAQFDKYSYPNLKNVVVSAPLGADSSITTNLLKQKIPDLQNVLVINGIEETGGLLTVNGELVDNTQAKVVDGNLHVRGTLVASGKWQDIGEVGFDQTDDGWVNTKLKNAKIEGNTLTFS